MTVYINSDVIEGWLVTDINSDIIGGRLVTVYITSDVIGGRLVTVYIISDVIRGGLVTVDISGVSSGIRGVSDRGEISDVIVAG